MRAHVPFLDTNKMEWGPGSREGVFTKILSFDPEVGARTALQCIDPARGYVSPKQQHYHDGDEEIFVLKGKFSFDQKNWLGALSYCFHPARTVHGFKSKTLEQSWFISRQRRPVTFDYADEPRNMKPYNLDGVEPARGVAVILDPLKDQWTDVRNEAGEVVLRRFILSRDPVTGEGAMLVRLMPGWESRHGDHFHSVYEETFHIEGETERRMVRCSGRGVYSFKPPFTVQSKLRSPKGALVYINLAVLWTSFPLRSWKNCVRGSRRFRVER
ncbi:MAG: cupin domain-containing protein [Alphaproteobacteria bacterium]